jgi:Tol biopolymer transport system component/thiol-disulfide isomerase/thioredoxin
MSNAMTSPTSRRAIRRLLAMAGIVAALATATAAGPDDKKAEVLLQAAQAKESIAGDLPGAIALYEQAITEAGANHALAAQALLAVAKCYERLGSTESRKAYERILREYPWQKDIAAIAQAKLRSASVARQVPRMSHREVWTAPVDVTVSGRVSGDGRYLPYRDDNDDLWIYDTLTNGDRRLTDAGPRESYCGSSVFAPGDGQIAYNWCDDGVPELRVVQVGGPGVPAARVLYRAPDADWVGAADWSPDGATIAAIVQFKNRRVQLLLVSAVNGSVRVAREFAAGVIDNAAFSTDGARIAYDRGAAPVANRDIFLLDLGSRHELSVVDFSGDDELLGWSADGGHLVFASDQVGTRAVWTRRVSGDAPFDSPKLVRELGSASSLGLTDSGTLYSVDCECLSEIKVATLDYDRGAVVGPATTIGTTRAAARPAWSRDGKSVAYVSRRGRSGGRSLVAITIRSMESGQSRDVLPALSALAAVAPVWARDDRSFLVTGHDYRGARGFFRVDRETGGTTLLASLNDGDAVSAPQLSLDGQTIYYRIGTLEGVDFVAHELGSDTTQTLASVPGFASFMLSPDRRQISVVDTRASAQSLTLMSIADDERRELVRLGPGQRFNGPAFFSPDGQSLVVPVEDVAGRSINVTLISTATTERRVIARSQAPQELAGVAMAWAPDGRSLVYQRRVGPAALELWQLFIDGREPRAFGLDPGARLTAFSIQPGGSGITFELPEPPKGERVWALSNFLPGAAAAARSARGPASPPTPETFASEMQKGETALAGRQYVTALEAFARANVARNRSSAEAWLGMSRAAYGLERFSEALKHAAGRTRLEAAIRHQRARALTAVVDTVDDDRLKEAEREFAAAAHLDAALAAPSYERGVALLTSYRDVEGIRELQAFVVRGGPAATIDSARRMIAYPGLARARFAAPAFSIVTPAGESLGSDSLRGKVVLLDFWGTWCPPCRVDTPALVDLHRRYGNQIVMIGVGVSESSERVWRDYIAENGMAWMQVLDESSAGSSPNRLEHTFNGNGVPTYILIDREGNIRHRITGGLTSDTPGALEAAIERAIGRR